MERQKAWDYIRLGQQLARLRRFQVLMIDEYVPHLNTLAELCQQLGMVSTTNTLGALPPAIERMANELGNAVRLTVPDNGQYETIDSLRDAVERTLSGESSAQLLAPLDRSAVSQKLIDFPNRWGKLTDAQQHLHDETVLCLETGAFRAAMVMGWNLVYDCLRQWVFDDKDRLVKFNAELKKRNSAQEVRDYEDFFTLGEWNVLEVCSKAGLFGGKTYDRLAHYLRERNDYAHANFVHASADYAKAYINHLLDILLGQPFKT